MNSQANSSSGRGAPINARLSCARDTLADLLAEPLIHAIPGACDALLDFKIAFESENPDARELLLRFFELRETLENRFYLSIFRLRQWIEQHVQIITRLRGAGSPQSSAVDTRYRNISQLEKRASQAHFESDLSTGSLDHVEVCFLRQPVAENAVA